MPTPPAQRPTAATARLRAAIQSVAWQHPLSPLTARQTTPSTTPAQNEPTPTRLPGAMPSLAAHNPPSPTDDGGEGRHATCAKARQTLPNHANARHHDQKCKTNPSAILSHPTPPPVPPVPNFQTNPFAPRTAPRSRPPRPLTPDQLRAARLLLAGHATNAIAAALHIDRHTLATWKRLPLFQQELRRLLDQSAPTNSTLA